MSFSQALDLLKRGKKVRRRSWGSYKKYVYLSDSGEYLFISTNTTSVSWYVHTPELLANDWEVVE